MAYENSRKISVIDCHSLAIQFLVIWSYIFKFAVTFNRKNGIKRHMGWLSINRK